MHIYQHLDYRRAVGLVDAGYSLLGWMKNRGTPTRVLNLKDEG
ncbi:hypothetical protein J2W40_002582 [Sphingobium xenophagum]|uniref:Uncharacterized protein n=1 Tax=Sphingobium xenophagum TaxID=121428 RepID=A0ABU1X3N6_SPHXE|nr:hypothetical protein [Sphingobium xenophagum]